MSDLNEQTPQNQPSPIKVIGVGGGGSNAVNTMYNRGIAGVDFIVCNTDAQALEASPVPTRVQLGQSLTSGQGAGSRPEVGRNAAIESLDEVTALLGSETKMVFITAGMGGGTGTGAAPVIAKAARDMDILTVGIVTIPFAFEGRRRAQQADEGLEAIRDAVDTLLIIRNDKLRELYSDLTIRKAFANADDVLCTAAKGIAEVITLTGDINVDMNDVNTVMKNSGRAIMGSGKASGEGRAYKAVTEALESPLLNDKDITGANFVLLNITFGTEEILMDEISEITDYIQDAAGQEADVIWGYAMDESLEDDLCVTIIATGFEGQTHPSPTPTVQKHILGATAPTGTGVTGTGTGTGTGMTGTGTGSGTGSGTGVGAGEDSLTAGIQLKSAGPASSMKWNMTIPKETTTPMMGGNDAPVDPEPIVPQTKVDEIPVTGSLAFTIKSLEDTGTGTGVTGTGTGTGTGSGTGVTGTGSGTGVTGTGSGTGLGAGADAGQVNRFTLNGDPLDGSVPQPERKPEQKIQTKEKVGAGVEDLVPQKGERISKIKQFTRRLKSPQSLKEMENEPAYKRRNVQLDDIQHSSNSNVSRISFQEEVDEDGEKRVEIRTDNPFLHDNVD